MPNPTCCRLPGLGSVWALGCRRLQQLPRAPLAWPQDIARPESRPGWLSQAHISQVREEKVAEERSKKKLSKKQGEADAWKQKVLRAVRATPGLSCVGEGKE